MGWGWRGAVVVACAAALACGGGGSSKRDRQDPDGSSSGGSSSGGGSGSSGSSSSGGGSSSSSSGSGSGSGGAGGLATQAAYEFVPETCEATSRTWTRVFILVAEATNYCKYVDLSRPNVDITCPPAGEKVLEIVLGRDGARGAVSRIGPGTYAVPTATSSSSGAWAIGTLLTGDGTRSCEDTWKIATAGAVTLTSATGGYQGSYDLVIDGKHVTGTLDTQRCWSGEDVRGPCAN